MDTNSSRVGVLDSIVAFARQTRLNGSSETSDWLRELIYKYAAVGCSSCYDYWSAGMFGERANSANEAKVGAAANGWTIDGEHMYCPSCTEKRKHED